MKKIFLYIVFIILVIVFLPKHPTKASHIMGGEMTYQYIGFDSITGMEQYWVYVSIYRNTAGIGCPGSVAILIWEDDDGDPLNPATLNQIAGSPVNIPQVMPCDPFPCPYDSALCGTGINFDIEICTYTGIIDVPQSLLGYHLTYSTCCRTVDNLSLSSSSMTWYAFIPPTYLENNSPVFTDSKFPYLCAGDTTTFLYTATDKDCDLLIYSFVHPFNSSANPLTIPIDTAAYQSGYNVNYPFGSDSYADINASTGLTVFMASDTSIYGYAVAVEIKEYRNGQLIGIVRRDIPYIAVNCPTQESPKLLQANGSGQTVYTIEEGDSLCFPIIFTDPEGDSLFLSRSGSVFDSLLVDPPAILTEVQSDSVISATFCWNIACGQDSACPYFFNLAVTDDRCPWKTTHVVYTINVTPYQGITEILGKDTICINEIASYTVDGTQGSLFTWNVAGGTILSGGTSGTITVQWSDTTQGYLKVSEVSACSNFDTLILPVKININNMIADASVDTLICYGDAIQLWASGGVFYSWSPSAGLDDTTLANPTASPSGTTTYIVTITDSSNCTASDTVIVNVVPEIVIDSLNSTNITCNGFNDGIITITASGGTGTLEDSITGFAWQPDGMPFAALSAGSYDVTIKDTNGCTTSLSAITITEPTAITAPSILSTPDTNNSGVGTATIPVSGGTIPYSYTWIPFGGNNVIAINLTPGTYTVVVTDANGCTYVDTVYIDNITGIPDMLSDDNIKIYPNPVSEGVNINFQLPENSKQAVVDIFNMVGKKVGSYDINNKYETTNLEISNLTNGLYFYTIIVNNNTIARDKLMIVK